MWSRHHVAAFSLTYCAYVMFHASRKVYSNSKDSLSQEWTPISCNLSWPCPQPDSTWTERNLFPSYQAAEPFLGLLDTLFLFSYSVGMFFTSFAADRYELRKGLSISMWLAGILLFVFGVLTQILQFYSKALYISMWILQGIVQSIAWPTCVAVVGNWFGKSGRGLLFGIWSSCAAVGNIMGNFIAAALIFYGYEYAFLTISAMLIGGGVIIFVGLVNSPLDVGLYEPLDEEPVNRRESVTENNMDTPTNSTSEVSHVIAEDDSNTKALSFLNALLLPGVIPYSLSFACFKLVNYAFFFWLPYYLTNNFHWDNSLSSKVSTWYDVGGIFGGIVAGLISDRLKTRSPVLLLMMVASPFALWGYKSSPNNVVINSVLMTIVGFFISGGSNLISTALAVDLAKQEAVGKNTKALATVTGIIDGTGSMGAAIGQYLVAIIQIKYDWGWVFNFFIIANVCGILFILPVFFKDMKQYLFCKKYILNRNTYSDLIDDTSDTG